MQFKPLGSKYFLRLVLNEEIIETIANFCSSQNIQFGVISGLGGSNKLTLGYYNLDEKEYHWQDFSGHIEVLSLNGNIALIDNEPVLHIHTAISDESFKSFGGHLKSGLVGGTLEVVIEKLDGLVERKMDDETGLNLLALPDSPSAT